MVNCELYFVDSDLFIVRCKLRNVSCQKWTASEPVLKVSRGVLSRLGSVLSRLEPSWKRLGDVLEAPKSVKNRSWSVGSMMATGQKSVLEGYSIGSSIFARIGVHRVKGDLSFLKDFGCPRLSKWRQI